MRASIRDIIVAIAFGTIVYRLVHTLADGNGTSLHDYREQTHISPLSGHTSALPYAFKG